MVTLSKRRSLTKSITWRLQFWHATILLFVVFGLSTAWYLQTRRARLSEIDAELLAAARVLDGSLRGIRLPWSDVGNTSQLQLTIGLQRRLSLPRPSTNRNADENDTPAPYFAIWLRDGRLLKSERLPEDFPTEQDASPEAVGDNIAKRGSNREVRIVGPSGTRILVGRNIGDDLESLRSLGFRIIAFSIGILTLGLVGGWWLTRSVLRPIHAMSTAAKEFSANDMSPRIDTRDTDTELGELAQLLNEAFDRVQTSFDQQQRFAADASHELRTPLAVIQSQIELALNKERSPEEYVKALTTCGLAGDRLSDLIESLLTLARFDSNQQECVHVSIRLDLIVAKCIDLMRPVADQAEVAHDSDITSVSVLGDAQQLEHAILNLLNNSIAYNHRRGSVQITVRAFDNTAELVIADTGIGISKEHLSRVAERFYRVDKARSRHLGGSGLGLAIVQKVIESHSGSIEISSVAGEGTKVTIQLPLTST